MSTKNFFAEAMPFRLIEKSSLVSLIDEELMAELREDIGSRRVEPTSVDLLKLFDELASVFREFLEEIFQPTEEITEFVVFAHLVAIADMIESAFATIEDGWDEKMETLQEQAEEAAEQQTPKVIEALLQRLALDGYIDQGWTNINALPSHLRLYIEQEILVHRRMF